jgi:hypothetical protein
VPELLISIVPGSATVVNRISVSGIGNGGSTGACITHQLWEDPVIPKVMVHSSELYPMNSLTSESLFVSLLLFSSWDGLVIGWEGELSPLRSINPENVGGCGVRC